ncbi:hypothetical protein E1B28_006168 [Marasmius oreades]|uniref:Macrofage activating glycoprotein n=1 Tax=Marasmius oreades TaxID=181124 RepID=A0A9P7UWC0_9AGAR|nr:uncharacterized protein E1B28_006168 [Marasmius oreades]KAG7095419.1 hypothetical protein E1B28_006168 [Marasmius oreades]
MFSIQFVFALSSFALNVAAQYSATFTPGNLPDKTQEGQTGTNKCSTQADQKSTCQNAYINSVEDFCLFAPPDPGPDSVIGNTERLEVAWCMKNGYGTRLIPDGTIKGAHFVKTPDFVQITGVGDLTQLNIPAGDAGGELDPHGADGNGNPIGGLVFSSAFGQLQQIHEWTNFMSVDQFCFRACNPAGSNPAGMCQHIYDVMGCEWNMPANYSPGTFENCDGESGEPMGVYGGSTFFQGQPNTPAGHPAPPSSNCNLVATISNGQAATGISASTTSASAKATSRLSTGSTPSGFSNAGSTPSGFSNTPAGAKATQTQTSNAAFAITTGGWGRLLYTAAMLFCSIIVVLL